jgi:hypothetical protein
MSNVLTFVKNPDGTITAQTAIATQDGDTITPSGQVVPATAVPAVVTYALSFLRDGDPQEQQLFGINDAGETVTGFLKLAQRYVLHLFTIKKSILYRPTQGCTFLVRVYQGRSTELDIFAAFSAAQLDVRRNMQAEEASTDPSDEKFKAAQLKQLTVGQGIITMTIVIQNVAGDILNVKVPLQFKL